MDSESRSKLFDDNGGDTPVRMVVSSPSVFLKECPHGHIIFRPSMYTERMDEIPEYLLSGSQLSESTHMTSSNCSPTKLEGSRKHPHPVSKANGNVTQQWPDVLPYKGPPPLSVVQDTWTRASLMKGVAPVGIRPHVDWRFKFGTRPTDPLSLEGWIHPYIETQCSHTCCTISGCVLVPWMRSCQLGVEYIRNSVLACELFKIPHNKFVRNMIPPGKGYSNVLNPGNERYKCMWDWNLMCPGYMSPAPPEQAIQSTATATGTVDLCFNPSTGQGIRDLCPADKYCSDSDDGKLQYLTDWKGSVPSTGKDRPLGDYVDGWTLTGKNTYAGLSGAAVIMWALDWLGPVHIGMYLHKGYGASANTIKRAAGSADGKKLIQQAAATQATQDREMPVVYWDAFIGDLTSGFDIEAIVPCEGCSKGHHCETLVGYRYLAHDPGKSYFILLDQHGQSRDNEGFAYLNMNLENSSCGGMFDALSQPTIYFSKTGVALRPGTPAPSVAPVPSIPNAPSGSFTTNRWTPPRQQTSEKKRDVIIAIICVVAFLIVVSLIAGSVVYYRRRQQRQFYEDDAYADWS